MEVTALTHHDQIAALMAEWRRLYAVIGRSLFENPEWHQVWWNHLGYRHGWAPHVITARSQGELVAVAPFAIRRARGLRQLEWAGVSAFDYPDILALDDVDLHAFWKHVYRIGRFDIARLRNVREDGHTSRALQSIGQAVGSASPVYAIDFTHASGQDWLKSLSKNTYKNLALKTRRMEQIGSVAMQIISDPAEVTPLISIMMRQKAEWAAAVGKSRPFLRDGAVQFLEELALQALSEGNLHLSVLTCDERPAAIHLGFVSRDGFYWYMPSYDQAFAKHSPGRLHLTRLVMWAIDNGLRRFDFLRGSYSYKRNLSTEARWLRLHDPTWDPRNGGGAALRDAQSDRSGRWPRL